MRNSQLKPNRLPLKMYCATSHDDSITFDTQWNIIFVISEFFKILYNVEDLKKKKINNVFKVIKVKRLVITENIYFFMLFFFCTILKIKLPARL